MKKEDAVKRIYHYTTIETLALILKSRSIRFNRLDKVDDIEEANTESDGIHLSKYVFVSCWTESSEENIPLWKLYSGGSSGVRISFEKDFFEEYFITNADGIYVEGGSIKSILPAKEFINTTHQFITFDIGSSTFFYRPIEYVDNIGDKISDIVKQTDASINVDFGEVGRYKQKRWEFQSESRFVLTAFPKDAPLDMSHPQFSDMVVRSMKKNIDLPFDEYFLKIKDDALKRMVVTLCPSATESQKIIVESLIRLYAPDATVEASNLKEKVRLK